MNFMLIKITIRRFFELLLVCVAISAVITLLGVFGLLTTRNRIFFGTLAGTIAFICINISMLRNCYFDLQGDRIYFLANISAYLIFAILSFAICFLCSNVVYAWLFSITKFARFTKAGLETHYSALIFHFIGFMTIFFSPIGMKPIIQLADDNE